MNIRRELPLLLACPTQLAAVRFAAVPPLLDAD